MNRSIEFRLPTTLLATGLMAALSLPVAATPIDLGAAGGFTVLGLTDGEVIINSATSLSGTVGYGRNVVSNTNQKVDTFIGTVKKHSTASVTITEATFAPTGGVLEGSAIDAELDQANADAIAASAFYGAMAGTSLGALGDGDNLDLTSTGGVNVYAIDSLDYKEDSITLAGGVGDSFVFNIAGDFDFSSSSVILTGGLLAENVLFNFTDASAVKINKSDTNFVGTILATTGFVDYHNPASFTGRIIARDINLHSNFNISGTETDAATPAPAPGALSLLMAGLVGLGVGSGRRGQRAQVKA